MKVVISRYHFLVNMDKPIQELPAGEQTMIEIVRTLLDKTNLIVLDEPTATLTNAETQLLFQAIRTLKDQGVTFVYVSHRIDEIFEVQNPAILKDKTWLPDISQAINCDLFEIADQ